MKRLVPPTLLLICLVVMILLWVLVPIAVIAPSPFNQLGLIPFVAGLALGGSGSRLFMSIGTNLNTFREPGKLVTDGLFQYTRNPMYLGMVLMLTGTWILTGVLSPVVCVLAFFIVADRWYIPFEENLLTTKFGDAYRTYQSRTRRWL